MEERDQKAECIQAILAGRIKWVKANYGGSIVVFFHSDYPNHLLAGVVQKFQWSGYLEPGHIPDFKFFIKGRSGKLLTISMVQAHVKACESWTEARTLIKEYYEEGKRSNNQQES